MLPNANNQSMKSNIVDHANARADDICRADLDAGEDDLGCEKILIVFDLGLRR